MEPWHEKRVLVFEVVGVVPLVAYQPTVRLPRNMTVEMSKQSANGVNCLPDYSVRHTESIADQFHLMI